MYTIGRECIVVLTADKKHIAHSYVVKKGTTLVYRNCQNILIWFWKKKQKLKFFVIRQKCKADDSKMRFSKFKVVFH